MSNNIKQIIEEIPIPAMLRERALMGIQQAKEERDAALITPTRKKRVSHRIIAASLIGLLTFGVAAIYNPHLSVAIQRALQFVPGIGVVQEVDSSIDSYMLTKPIDIQLTDRKLTITAMFVQEHSTTIKLEMYTKRVDSINIIGESGKVYEGTFSGIGGDGEGGSPHAHVTYLFPGHIDIKDNAKLYFIDSPNESFTIPLTKVDSTESLHAIGESTTVHDLQITAVPTPAGQKGRIFLSTEHSNQFRYNDAFLGKGDISLNNHISITDELGNEYPIDNKGLHIPFKDIYFKLGSSDVKKYTLTIPQLTSIGQDKVNILIDIPEGKEGIMNQSFDIAGYPVEMTTFKKYISRSKRNLIEIDVEMPNPLKLTRSLKDFDAYSTLSPRINKTHDATTSIIRSFTVEYDPNDLTKLGVTILNPVIDMKGPWVFELEADQFNSKQNVDRE